MFLGALGLLFAIGSISPSESTPSYSESSYATPTIHSDYTLEIPQIGLTSQMTRIINQGRTLPVPDNVPGYFSTNEQNLFIVGHTPGVFQRLSELPSTISIWLNGESKTYHLTRHQIMSVESISMGSLLAYDGVVLMTCNGADFRLILWYSY